MCEDEVKEDSPLKKLSWVPDLQVAVQQWEWDLEKAKKQVEHLKKSIKTTKGFLKETERDRPKLFAAVLEDADEVFKAYSNDFRVSFRSTERKQIHAKHNRMLIVKLLEGNIHTFKRYLWETETFQTSDDWDFVAQTLIELADINVIKTFMKFQLKYMTENSREKLVEYLDSRALADVMVAAE